MPKKGLPLAGLSVANIMMCKSYLIGRRVNAWSRAFSVLCVGFEAALGAIPRSGGQGVVVVVEKDILEAHRCAGRLDRR